MMTGCCTIPPREAPAIPLWINGRPMLAMPLRFHEIRESATQRLIRRVPLVDETLAASALAVAAESARLGEPMIPGFLAALTEALEELEAHFAGLSAVESQTHLDMGKADVQHALEFVRGLQDTARSTVTISPERSLVLALAGAGMPLTAALKLVLPVVIGGGAVVLVPHADAPSCALALAELCGQCGLPDGVFNVVYVDEAVAQQLLVETPAAALRLFGPSAWAQRWQAVALGHALPCELVLA